MPEVYSSNAQDQNSTLPPTQMTSSPVVKAVRSSTDYSEVMKLHKETRNPLAAFMVRPPLVHMGIQEGDEKVLLLLRRHFITNVPWILAVVGMIFVPLIVGLLPFGINLLPARFTAALAVLWYLLTFGVGLEGFLSWYYNVYVITDERIIDVDFLNLIYKNVSSTKIDKVEDVTVEMGGALRSLLNFGTLLIQTAAEQQEFEFEDVPQPQEVAKFINEMILEEEREQLEGRVS